MVEAVLAGLEGAALLETEELEAVAAADDAGLLIWAAMAVAAGAGGDVDEGLGGWGRRGRRRCRPLRPPARSRRSKRIARNFNAAPPVGNLQCQVRGVVVVDTLGSDYFTVRDRYTQDRDGEIRLIPKVSIWKLRSRSRARARLSRGFWGLMLGIGGLGWRSRIRLGYTAQPLFTLHRTGRRADLKSVGTGAAQAWGDGGGGGESAVYVG